jgi:hypothetical protein
MHTLYYWINSVPDIRTRYQDLDDALRRANELWDNRHQLCRGLGIDAAQCHVEFKIISDDGPILEHGAIMEEINRRPDHLKIPPKLR